MQKKKETSKTKSKPDTNVSKRWFSDHYSVCGLKRSSTLMQLDTVKGLS